MPFNEKSRLDPSQVQDRRGMGTGTRIAIGGGGIGIIILVLTLLLGGNPGDLTDLVGLAPATQDPNSAEIGDLAAECQTGADANTRQDCAIVGYVNSIQDFWTDERIFPPGSYLHTCHNGSVLRSHRGRLRLRSSSNGTVLLPT